MLPLCKTMWRSQLTRFAVAYVNYATTTLNDADNTAMLRMFQQGLKDKDLLWSAFGAILLLISWVLTFLAEAPKTVSSW